MRVGRLDLENKKAMRDVSVLKLLRRQLKSRYNYFTLKVLKTYSVERGYFEQKKYYFSGI